MRERDLSFLNLNEHHRKYFLKRISFEFQNFLQLFCCYFLRAVSKEFILKENDMILLSSQTDNLMGISQGFVQSIKNNQTVFSLLIDKNLAANSFKINSEHLFRIDKINFRSSNCLNYTNLSRLFIPSEMSTRLRSWIIEKNPPTFQVALPKQDILRTKELFKKLNQSQKAAILKAIMANDYLLIKGYPGTVIRLNNAIYF